MPLIQATMIAGAQSQTETVQKVWLWLWGGTEAELAGQ